jgi:primosomal protein N' (replication factor Y)
VVRRLQGLADDYELPGFTRAAAVAAAGNGVPIVLGTATPALETLANVEAGRYVHLRLPTRAGNARRPQIELVDIRRRRLVEGLAPTVRDAIALHARRGEQVLVFKNRRGYAPRLACHACGWHADCHSCDTPITLHRSEGLLRCHHCGAVQRLPRLCPACGSTDLVAEGIGTERLEESLTALLPDVPVIRVDRDTTRTKSAFDALFDRLETGAPAVLVGTQMLAKGHHNVKLDAEAAQDVRAVYPDPELPISAARWGSAGDRAAVEAVIISLSPPAAAPALE